MPRITRSFLTPIFGVTIILSLFSCSGSRQSVPEPISNQTSTSESGEALTNQRATRIVTLTSISADMIHVLAPQKLVGVPGSKLIKANKAFDDIPTVTEGRTPPDTELILSLKPDLVIGAEGFHTKTLTQLNQLGIRTLSTEIKSWSDFIALGQTLSIITASSSSLLRPHIENCFPTNRNSSLSTVLLVSKKPLLTPNQNSWAGNLLSRFDLINKTADFTGKSRFNGYVTLSPEKLVIVNPQTLLLVDTRDGLLAFMKAEPYWKSLAAVKSGKVFTLEYYGLVNPGSLSSINSTCSKLNSIK